MSYLSRLFWHKITSCFSYFLHIYDLFHVVISNSFVTFKIFNIFLHCASITVMCFFITWML